MSDKMNNMYSDFRIESYLTNSSDENYAKIFESIQMAEADTEKKETADKAEAEKDGISLATLRLVSEYAKAKKNFSEQDLATAVALVKVTEAIIKLAKDDAESFDKIKAKL